MSLFHESDIYRSILESLPAGPLRRRYAKKIDIWSDGAERITGHLRHDVVGHSCVSESLLHCDQPGCEFCKKDCPVARAIKTSHATESNRRISVIVQYIVKNNDDENTKTSPTEQKTEGS